MKTIHTVLLVLVINISFSQSDNFKYTVEIPETFELANVLVALTDFGEADDNIVKKNTAYYDSVKTYFQAYKGLAIINRLNDILNKSRQENYNFYINFRTISYFFTIENNKLVKKKDRIRSNFFKDFEEDINDFIKKSGYMEFYNAHVGDFNNYTNAYKSNIPIKDMVEWLNSRFPSRFNNYHIVMSPLIGGFHNTKSYINSSGDKSTFISVGVPYHFRRNEEIDDYAQGQYIRAVFTEIDHNYVNPISDNCKRKIKHSIRDIRCWNNSAQGYNSDYLTFNEYMTWAVYSVFIRDYFDQETFKKLNNNVAQQMQNKRGFTKFQAFNDRLLSLTADDPNKKLEDFVPDMLEWMCKQECTKVN